MNGDDGSCICNYPITNGECKPTPDCAYPSHLDTTVNTCVPPIDSPPCVGVLIDDFCHPECEDNEHMNNDGSCDCNSNYVEKDGKCEPSCELQGLVTALDGSCKEPCHSSELTDLSGNCYCPPNTKKNDDGECKDCPEDFMFSSDLNDCVPTPCELRG
jgi:hypothetical protein